MPPSPHDLSRSPLERRRRQRAFMRALRAFLAVPADAADRTETGPASKVDISHPA